MVKCSSVTVMSVITFYIQNALRWLTHCASSRFGKFFTPSAMDCCSKLVHICCSLSFNRVIWV